MKWKAKNSLNIEHSISDIYVSLCIFRNQAWIPVSVLGRLWKMDETLALGVVRILCDMSLAKLRLERNRMGTSRVDGIVLHDLQLEFCRDQAAKRNKASQWHRELINGYLGTTWEAEEQETFSTTKPLKFKSEIRWTEVVAERRVLSRELCKAFSIC